MALSLPPDVDREGAAIVIGDDVAPSVAAGARLRGGAHSDTLMSRCRYSLPRTVDAARRMDCLDGGRTRGRQTARTGDHGPQQACWVHRANGFRAWQCHGALLAAARESRPWSCHERGSAPGRLGILCPGDRPPGGVRRDRKHHFCVRIGAMWVRSRRSIAPAHDGIASMRCSTTFYRGS